MIKTISCLLFLFHFSFFVSAQSYNANTPPNKFRSESNPLYWKNRLPYAGYWQQDVYYKIDATIDEDSSIITGSETLKYWNNSPDTLTYVYFHLYQNMTLKGGHQANLVRNNKVKQKFGKYEEQGFRSCWSSTFYLFTNITTPRPCEVFSPERIFVFMIVLIIVVSIVS